MLETLNAAITENLISFYFEFTSLIDSYTTAVTS